MRAVLRQRRVLAAVAGHLLLTALHGVVHAAIPVVPAGLTFAFAFGSLYVLPVAGAVLSMRGRSLASAAVLFGAGVAGFAFEGVFHFLVANPDHVAHVAAHKDWFGVTAVLTTAGDLLLVAAAWLAISGVEQPEVEVLGCNLPVRRFFE